ncbi:hypothetical protein H0H87_009258 [Tephrocybe sp. NHM501043]|nr:hypothetical protein H0H87_009258 [Tephrocybe sp. NHM501043]
MAITTNVVASSLIVLRIWGVKKGSSRYRTISTFRNQDPLSRAIMVTVESGLVYTVSLIALVVIYLVIHASQFAVQHVVVQIIGITFNLIIVQSQRRNDDRDSISFRRFTPPQMMISKDVEVTRDPPLRARADSAFAERTAMSNESTSTTEPEMEGKPKDVQVSLLVTSSFLPMNDPGLGKPIQEGFQNATRSLRDQKCRSHGTSQQSLGPRAEFLHELEVDDEEEELGFTQPKQVVPVDFTRLKAYTGFSNRRWWFTSTAFPLIAGTFGPLANLFSVCALVQTWRIAIPDGGTEINGTHVNDPPWLLVLNAVSLALALVANMFLLMNFAHRVRYTVAQPLTIILWYLAAILLIVPLGMTHTLVIQPTSTHAFAQSYYYAIISATLYIVISSILVLNAVGAYFFEVYPLSFNSLTIPQRTLMLQTVSYILYLALGAGVFSAIEEWTFCDGLYWADYTLLTIGIGSDFPLRKSVSQALLIPYAAFGIMMIGLLVGSVRGLVLERGKIKIARRSLAKQRERLLRHARWEADGGIGWKKQEFECMREMQRRAQLVQQFSALGTSFFAFIIVWLAGALVFWFSEKVYHHHPTCGGGAK